MSRFVAAPLDPGASLVWHLFPLGLCGGASLCLACFGADAGSAPFLGQSVFPPVFDLLLSMVCMAVRQGGIFAFLARLRLVGGDGLFLRLSLAWLA